MCEEATDVLDTPPLLWSLPCFDSNVLETVSWPACTQFLGNPGLAAVGGEQ